MYFNDFYISLHQLEARPVEEVEITILGARRIQVMKMIVETEMEETILETRLIEMAKMTEMMIEAGLLEDKATTISEVQMIGLTISIEDGPM